MFTLNRCYTSFFEAGYTFEESQTMLSIVDEMLVKVAVCYYDDVLKGSNGGLIWEVVSYAERVSYDNRLCNDSIMRDLLVSHVVRNIDMLCKSNFFEVVAELRATQKTALAGLNRDTVRWLYKQDNFRVSFAEDSLKLAEKKLGKIDHPSICFDAAIYILELATR